MKILITGGAGFIGSNLADRLTARGDEVFIIDNLKTGKLANLRNLGITSISSASFEGRGQQFWFENIADASLIRQIFNACKPDTVVHAAATGVDPDAWQEDVRSNVLGTVNVINSSLLNEVERFIYLQTSLCYGLPKWSPITLDHPINPTGSYAITKTAAERFVFMSGLDYVSFRLCNCYGPRNWTGPIPVFYRRLKEGKQCFVADTRREFVYIDDLLDLILMAVDGTGKGIYHVSGGKDHQIEEIYYYVSFEMGETLPPGQRKRGKDDIASILLDPSRTVNDFGFEPKVSLQEGIKRTIQWYKTQGVEKVYTHLKGFDT